MRRAAALLAVCTLLACTHDEERSRPAPPPASASASAPVPHLPPAIASASAPPPPCRVIAKSGVPGLHERDAPPADFLSLPAGGKITVEDTRSTRQTTFLGPGAVWACVGGDEAAWLAEGTFDSVAGAGERPGAEEWLTTGEAVIRYSSARLRVIVTPQGTVAQLSAGAASVLPVGPVARPDGGAPEGGAGPDAAGWRRLVPGVELRVLPIPGGPRAAVGRCEREARAARELADAIGRPDADLGNLTPRHVIARETARAACAVAGLLAHHLPDGPEHTSLVARAEAGDAAWRIVPTGRP